MSDTVAILGAGAWGSALAAHLGRVSRTTAVRLWARDAMQAGIRMMGRAYETDEPQRMVGAARARLRDRKK